ncbi:DUF943 family protein [Enterobacteriaceae bacterium LUAb1]
MRVKNKKTIALLTLAGCALSGYWLWLSLRPVEIVAVHKDGEFSSVLVRNFPFTDRGKINWWLKNKGMLKEKYHIPQPEKNGFFSIVFWDFAEGYKEQDKYDRRCFEDMQPPLNCIDKNRIFSIWNTPDNTISFGVDDGEYTINKKGVIVRNVSK